MTTEPRAPFNSVLIANRGEIAVRIARSCADMGITSVACYAEPDAGAPHVLLADVAFPLPGATAAETYLDADALLRVAKEAGAEAVHPGYGFLAEDANFAQAVIDAGLTWVGPTPSAMRLLGDKVSARAIARQVGAPMAAGTDRPVEDAADVQRFADEHGLPVAIKAAHGGGGRGLKVARTTEEIPALFASAVREAKAAFGRGECFVERYLSRARHVEAQILADKHGTVLVVGTRDCSLQRRHQKLVEEAPAPFLSESQRDEIHAAAAALCSAANYDGAGTVEFLLGEDGTLSFLEVNTRLQVEHPVTEETTGIDLVAEQFRIAAGEPLTLDPAMLAPRGHSIEFRINGEDPDRGFLPAQGTVTRFQMPSGPGVRMDSGITLGSVIGGSFDSLLAKLVVTGRDRTQALTRARTALAELSIEGLATVVPFHRDVVEHPDFVGDGQGFSVYTRWIDQEYTPRASADDSSADGEVPSHVPVRIGNRTLNSPVPGLASLEGETARTVLADIRAHRSARQDPSLGDVLRSPMQGTVVRVNVTEGQHVEAGELIAVVEAMKMENPVSSHWPGLVEGLAVAVGDTVAQDALICRVTAISQSE